MSRDDLYVPDDPSLVKAAKDDQRFFSVTTLIGVLDKPALQYWAAEEAAKEAIRIRHSLDMRIQDDGEEAVIKHLRDARLRRPKGERTAAELGSAVHAALEHFALHGTFPDADEEVRPFLEQYERWASHHTIEHIASEMPVFSPTYGYAGTMDGIMRFHGQAVVFDYKTSRKSFDSRGKDSMPYPEVALQLSAYRYADFALPVPARRTEVFRRRYYLLSESEKARSVAVPEVVGALAIHITPEHCRAYPIKADKEVFERFLYIVEAARWPLDMSKRVMGDPID